jgi:RNA polymerase sigma-70 factor (ECF subfamily)
LRAVENLADERLLIEAAQHDPSRFAELYETNFERVYAFVAHRVPNREEAQDLTAEVFHQALANIENFEWRGAPFVAWLLGIAAKVLSGYWQRLAKRQELSTGSQESSAADDKIEQRAMLFQLVNDLPPDQRHVIIRRFVDQRSIREVAQEMGRTEGAVKQLQLRAVQGLRTKLKE